MAAKKQKALTLVEMLVVIAVIALVIGITTPALVYARSQGKSIVCRSNLRQLFIANAGYATENSGSYVPAAPDIFGYQGGLYRWHGVRVEPNMPFDPAAGPLADYLADGAVKNCPERIRFRHDDDWEWSFENGCGGYGYNMTYLGSRQWQKGLGFRDRYEQTTSITEVRRPGETLMFADCAMARLKDGVPYLHEYSFAEPPRFVIAGKIIKSRLASPSIHFRHRLCANVAWTDGHIAPEPLAESGGLNAYGADSAAMLLGWFDPVDNTPFDLD